MAKKAYLVQFTATTRIIVDSDKDPNESDGLFGACCDEAFIRMGDFGFENYLNGENATISEDTEQPYDEESSIDRNCKNTIKF